MAEKEARGSPAAVVLSEAEALAALATLEAQPHGALPAEVHVLAADYRTARQILDRATIGIAVLDHTLRYRYVNEALAELNGVAAEDHLGRTVSEVLPGINADDAGKALTAVLRDGRPRAITVRGATRSDHPAGQRWWHNTYHRLHDASGRPLGAAAMVLEITTDRVIRQSLDRARKRLTLLDQAATHIGTTLDVQRTCEELTQLLVPQLADIAAVDVLEAEQLPPPPGPLRMRRIALSTTRVLQWAGHYLGAPGAVIATHPASAAARCLDEQRSVVLPHPEQAAPSTAAWDNERTAFYQRLGLDSGCYVPLAAGRDTIGVVGLGRTGDRAAFSPEDVDLITELVRRAANSIDNAQRYTQQRDTAVVLQRALLSNITAPHPDVECASRYLPTGAGAEVGGDWYDSIALPDGTTVLVIGDVMGHGLDAAATMAEYRATVRTLAFQQLPPDRVLTEADALVQALDLERMATCLVAALDPRTRTLHCSSAGHLAPLLVLPGCPGRLRLLDEIPVGPPLGAACSRYESTTVTMPPGSGFLLYTDGLIERRDQDIDDSLAELASLDLDPAQPLDRMLDTVLSRLAADPGEDDAALLIARLRESPR